MKSDLKTFLFQSAIYTVSDGMIKAGGLFLLPIYTRLLTPADFGLLGLVGTISVLTITIVSLGTRGAIHRFYFQFSKDDERGSFYGSLWIFLIIVPAIGIFFVSFTIKEFFGGQFFGINYDPFLSLGIWTQYFNLGFVTFLILILRASGNALKASLFNIFNFFIPSGLSIAVLIYLNNGTESVLWGKFIGMVLVSIYAIKYLQEHINFEFAYKQIPPALLYSIPLILHFLCNWILTSSDQLIIKYFYSLSEVGIYNIGYQIGSAPVYVAASIYTAILPFYGKTKITSFRQKADLTRLITYYVMFSTSLVLVIAIFSTEIVRFAAPLSYQNASLFVPWIALGALFTSLYYLPAATLTHIVGNSKWLALGTVLAGATNIILNLVFVPIAGAYAAAITTAFSYFVLFLFVFIVSTSKVFLPYEIKRLFIILFLATVLFFISNYIALDQLWLQILLKFLLLLLYPLSLYLLDFFTDEELRQFIFWRNRFFRPLGG